MFARLTPALGITLALAFGALGFAQTLTVYSGRNEAFMAPVIERFQAEIGVSVDARYGNTAALAATILEEGQNSPADVYIAQDAGALGALARAGVLSELPDEVLNRVQPRFRSPAGLWVGVTGRARVLSYNTESVDESELPSSVFELTEPQWQGRVGWAPSNGSFQAFVTAMRVLEGEEYAREWLTAMLANGVQDYPNNRAIVEATARGEIELGLVNHYYLFQFIAEQGEGFPARNHFLEDADLGGLINVAGAGVLTSSDQRELAVQFVDYLLSAESQAHFADEVYEYPLVEGIAVNPLLPPLAELETPELDLSDLDDLEGTVELLQEVGAL
ncbi:iron ABC transporter substrate-binding protein [soil metagenome]